MKAEPRKVSTDAEKASGKIVADSEKADAEPIKVGTDTEKVGKNDVSQVKTWSKNKSQTSR